MTANDCVRCNRPTPDGQACSPCAYRAGDQLHEIADMAPAARDIAHGFAHRGSGGSSGKPGSRLPLDLGATSKLDHVQARLSTWVGEIAHARNRPIPAPRHLGDDPIVLWARWLAGHVEWVRHTDDAELFLREVDECARVVRGLARGPAEQKYLGPCGAYPFDDNNDQDDVPCEGDVYASRGSRVGRCRTCGAEVASVDREAWLDGEVRSHAFRASEIANAHRINVKTIRTWHARGLLVAHGQDAAGTPLFNVGEVLDLAAADAARRAGEQAKRARRAEETARKQAERQEAVVGYMAVHQRLRRDRGPASSHRCAKCRRVAEDWAYDHTDPDELEAPDGPYSMDPAHYQPLCRRCHKALDGRHRAAS